MKLSGAGCLFFEITRKKLNSQIRGIVLRVVQTSKDFWFFSINQLGGPLRNMFTCDWCIFIHFLCFYVSRFVSISFLWRFSDRSYSCLSQEKSNVCLLPSTRMPLIIAISFAIPEQSKVILSFVFAGQAERARCIVICINPTHTQMIDVTEKPIRSLQTRRAIQRIRL